LIEEGREGMILIAAKRKKGILTLTRMTQIMKIAKLAGTLILEVKLKYELE